MRIKTLIATAVPLASTIFGGCIRTGSSNLESVQKPTQGKSSPIATQDVSKVIQDDGLADEKIIQDVPRLDSRLTAYQLKLLNFVRTVASLDTNCKEGVERIYYHFPFNFRNVKEEKIEDPNIIPRDVLAGHLYEYDKCKGFVVLEMARRLEVAGEEETKGKRPRHMLELGRLYIFLYKGELMQDGGMKEDGISLTKLYRDRLNQSRQPQPPLNDRFGQWFYDLCRNMEAPAIFDEAKTLEGLKINHSRVKYGVGYGPVNPIPYARGQYPKRK